LKAFSAFGNAEKAILNAQSVAEGTVSEDLKIFLTANLPE